jgi:hypothetical protein
MFLSSKKSAKLIIKTRIILGLVIFLSSILLIGIVSSSSHAYAQQSSRQSNQQFPESIIAASSTDTTPHALKLRATQEGEDGQPKKVSGFKIDLTNVVTAQINSQVLVFATDSSLQIIGAKVRTVSGQLIDLVPSTTTQTNAFSVAGLPVGVYTLDIISQKGNTKAAYEGILVISQQPTAVINETTKQVINQEINQNTRVDTDNNDNDNDDNNDKEKKTGEDCWDGFEFVGKDECDTGGNPLCSEVRGTVERPCFDEGDYPDTEDTKREAGVECQSEDDYCDYSEDCDSPDVDCIDDVNRGDDGEDADGRDGPSNDSEESSSNDNEEDEEDGNTIFEDEEDTTGEGGEEEEDGNTIFEDEEDTTGEGGEEEEEEEEEEEGGPGIDEEDVDDTEVEEGYEYDG